MASEEKKDNQKSSIILDKKQLFAKGLSDWRQKYAKELNQFSDEEIDSIFARAKDEEPIISHSEVSNLMLENWFVR